MFGSLISRLSAARTGIRRRRIIALIRKKLAAQTPDAYRPRPLAAAIVQTFNRRDTISPLVCRLQSLPFEELIVVDDGSIDGTWERALALLTRRNDFLLRSNDLHEIRMYDRALGLTKARYVALLQDDDLPPQEPSWVHDAIRLFEADSRLIVLGGRTGADLLMPDPAPTTGTAEYTEAGGGAGRPGVTKARSLRTPTSRLGGVAFQYAMTVNRAPMWIRREEFMRTVGIDQTFAPYMCDDVDCCLRAWQMQWHVGLYRAGFRNLDEGGMRLFNADRSRAQVEKNWKLVYERHGGAIRDGALQKHIDDLNRALCRPSQEPGNER